MVGIHDFCVINHKEMNDQAIELKLSFGKKLACIISSLMLSLIAGNIVLVPFVLIGSFQNIFHLSKIVAGLIVFIGISLDIFIIIVSYKKMYRYFTKDFAT